MQIFTIIEAKNVACENVQVELWSSPIGNTKACNMKKTTSINERNIKISNSDGSVGGLTFGGNKKITFMPIEVAQSFPKLLGYSTYDCSVKEVSQENLKGLRKLKKLWLGENQIEKIPSNTLEDLVELEFLQLCELK